jgi:hypothetical protein
MISDIEIRVLWNRHPFPPIDLYLFLCTIHKFIFVKKNSCLYILLAFLYMNYERYLYNYIGPSMFAMKKIKIVS